MLHKILIANRGEIAARIIRTCKKMGIQTVVVYSEADATAPFVSQADEAYLLGAARVDESYMNMDKIFEIAAKAKVDAIHPGYGFFSEHAGFAATCRDKGFVFIGPSAAIIEKMGDKIQARKLMQSAGVPIVPGTEAAVASAEEAVSHAKQIGYPVMLKAAAGGGGIGMHVVHSDEECLKVFASNADRAKRFFGNGAMFIEKKIENAHHIEVQVLADKHGNAVHLFDRECSVQRRNQKVIEEAVSPFISEATRKALCEISAAAVQKIGYENAGTLEFIVDSQENFYFLEMNTRIQVEHPITEEITGLDIVAEQIHIAAGEPLSVSQAAINRSGHAIEARVYAENPKTFLPSPGEIETLTVPEMPNLRNEVAICAQYMVTPFYDPMIAKVVAKGDTRAEAIQNLIDGLSAWEITGIQTNLDMLLTVLQTEAFQTGNTTTDFVDKHYLPLI